ncbi:hypothetical protein C5C45_00395 [Rathayibacter rathayi]|uniref:RRM domain-containing protein n=1 Tax=Rathayibacter rathayi TaxID=33887 RepID=A0ABX5AEE9_RATRA|nr:hypothetical protein C5C34_06020 [Rathayibacter rathayi]PPF51604.1 hypothetical protein C5C08_02010 [Rathayibacter rathayi]PPF83195.1 hypothetical protein C5C14_02050 [Rathayibacter rathayi]PPG47025.1 hypothetical protein C5C20_02005 [Rathayibacter rathayi]PPH38941.1 hypothetical protein C5C28_01860 [Rathayibacter rathayi]
MRHGLEFSSDARADEAVKALDGRRLIYPGVAGDRRSVAENSALGGLRHAREEGVDRRREMSRAT